MSAAFETVGVIGGGAWGTALAAVAARAGRDVVLWARDGETVAAINRAHVNRRYLPEIPLEEAIRATGTLGEAVRCDVLVLAVPAQTVRAVTGTLVAHSRAGQPVVIAAKGLERASGAFMADVVTEELPGCLPAVLSGPSFAADVARGLPTAVTLACSEPEIGARLVETFGQPAFRPYRSTDIVGTQIGGAVKNVLAIACGIVEGRGLGASAHAALIARAFAEMRRLGEALGARPETLAGLAGLGDLVLTGTSRQSRNFRFGIALGEGGSIEAALGQAAVTEGVWTAPAVVARAAMLGIEMPISAAVASVLDGRADVETAIQGLLARPFREEG